MRTPAWQVQWMAITWVLLQSPRKGEGLAVRSLGGEVSVSPWSQPHLSSDSKQPSTWGGMAVRLGPAFPGRRPKDHTLDLWYSLKSPPDTKSWEKKVPKGRTDSGDKAAQPC